jgi:hypothetical protein
MPLQESRRQANRHADNGESGGGDQCEAHIAAAQLERVSNPIQRASDEKQIQTGGQRGEGRSAQAVRRRQPELRQEVEFDWQPETDRGGEDARQVRRPAAADAHQDRRNNQVRSKRCGSRQDRKTNHTAEDRDRGSDRQRQGQHVYGKGTRA